MMRALLQRLAWLKGSPKARVLNKFTPNSAKIISRDNHSISRYSISDNALKVLYRLANAGFAAYMVGGGVRDLLLGRAPKDFDIATDAYPEQVKSLFRNARLIGRRFRLVHVCFGREIIEVSTFRKKHGFRRVAKGEKTKSAAGLILKDNVYGSIKQDVWRRDFTINALYYNIRDFSLVDYAGGVKDLQAKVIRLIGNPVTRYREDPVRMLRAIRFAAKLDFTIHPNTAAPIANLGELLTAISPARLFDEVLKLLLSKHAVATFELLCQYNLLRYLVPATASCIDRDKAVKSFIHQACANTEARLATGKTVAPAFLYSVLLWYPLQQGYQQRLAKQGRPMTSLQQATSQVLNEQLKHTAIPKRFAWVIRDIWQLQWQLGRPGKRALSVLNHPRFRAGYDFLLTRQQAGEPLAELADWWTRLQQVDEEERQRMISQRTKPTKRSNYRRLSAKPTHST